MSVGGVHCTTLMCIFEMEYLYLRPILSYNLMSELEDPEAQLFIEHCE